MLTNKLASDILSQEDAIECTNDTSEMRKSTFTKANILAPPLERFKAKLNNRSAIIKWDPNPYNGTARSTAWAVVSLIRFPEYTLKTPLRHP